MVYDFAGNVLANVDALGNRTSFTYDEMNRRYQTLDANGGLATTVYDTASNVVASVDQRGYRTSYAYDVMSRRTQTTDALLNLSTTVYDAAGNTLATVDALNHRTSTGYDAVNRATTRTDALNFTTATAYDAVSNVVTVMKARGYLTSYLYDKVNRRTQTIDALGHTSTTMYDAAGNVIKNNNFAGNTSTLVESVNADPTTVAVASSLNPATSGQAFTATVRAAPPGAGTPSGTVTFKDGATVLGSSPLTAARATFSTSALTLGNHALGARNQAAICTLGWVVRRDRPGALNDAVGRISIRPSLRRRDGLKSVLL